MEFPEGFAFNSGIIYFIYFLVYMSVLILIKRNGYENTRQLVIIVFLYDSMILKHILRRYQRLIKN